MAEQQSKQVFLGGASDDAARAGVEKVATILQSANCVPLPWWTTRAFQPGFSLLHNIQNIPRMISGAIFLATPDDEVILRQSDPMFPGKKFLPRADVMLELGHFMGALGASNVAICRYRECTLPSDLDGVKWIDMGFYHGDSLNKAIEEKYEEDIEEWAKRLPYAAGLSITQVVQGYTGRWEIFGKYSRWQGDLIDSSDKVELTGYLDLWVPKIGASGHGVMHGQLTLDLKTRGIFAEFRITSLMNNVNCDLSGALSFETEIFCHRLMYKRTPHNKEFENELGEGLIGYPRHSWSLTPCPTQNGKLTGCFELPDHGTAASVEARKTFS